MSQFGGSLPLGLWWLGVWCWLVGFCVGFLEMVLVSSIAEATGLLGEWFCVGLNNSKILGWVLVLSFSFDLVFEKKRKDFILHSDENRADVDVKTT